MSVDEHLWTWRHILYRLVDAGDRLLYVGITNDLNERFRHHRGEKDWWPEVADCRIEFFPDRVTLEVAEQEAIWTEAPKYNRRGLPGPHSGRRFRRRGAAQSNGGAVVSFRLDRDVLALLVETADRAGVDVSELLRRYCYEGLQRDGLIPRKDRR